MTDRFNRLTPAEDEALTLLQEECAEVIHVICKAKRHGLDSHHPESGESNLDGIHREVGQLYAAVQILLNNDILKPPKIDQAYKDKLRDVHRYLHHVRVEG